MPPAGRRRRGRRSGRLVRGLLVALVFLLLLWVLDDATTPQPTGSAAFRSGMWISDAELAALPTSGRAWESLEVAAHEFESSMTDYGDQDSTDGAYALAAALVYARTGDQGRRQAVIDAIAAITSEGYDTSSNPSSLGWARSLTAWVVASDLVDLFEARPQLGERWRRFLAGMVEYPYAGDGGDDLLDLATGRANNIGAVARTAVTAIAVYTSDNRLLERMAELYRAWVEGSEEERFDWDKDKDRSWQCSPDEPMSYRGINAPCTRDGNDLGGVLAEEYRRTEAYDGSEFPGPNETKYPWEALGAAVAQAELLRRAGYGDALDWGGQAPRRALERLHELHRLGSDDGWTFGRAAGGGSDDRWIIPLVNGLYGSSFPEPSETGPGRPLSWADWTHGGDGG